jgi:hypothetical protein
MQLILLVATANAGSVLWLGSDQDPTVLPEHQVVQVDDLVARADPTAGDQAALDGLQAELDAVRPLIDAFDGELEIMSRLDAGVAEVTLLRSEADRDLVYAALVFQGYAVQRYFQDQLATDPAAAPYRTELNGQVVVKAWVDAVALDPAREPDAALLPPGPEQIAFDQVRAQIRLAPKATVVVSGPPGTQVAVDGWPAVDATTRVKVAPGMHWVAVTAGDGVALRSAQVLEAGQELELQVGAQRADFDELQASLSASPEAVRMPAGVADALAQVGGPVFIVVPGGRAPLIYQVQDQTAVLQEAERDTSAPTLIVRGSLGAGWMYDGGWYLGNVLEGAPSAKSTVNSGLPVFGAQADLRLGPTALGAGVDLAIPLGTWHTLPSGDSSVRLRTHPYVAFGLPMVQVTAGYLFPWQWAVGARARVPVGPVEIGLNGVYGIGRTLDQADNPDGGFAAEDAFLMWASVGYAWGR